MRFVGSRLLVGLVAVTAALFAVVPSALASNASGGGGMGGGMGGGTVQLGPPTLVWQAMIGKSLIRQQNGSLTFTGTIAGSGSLDVLAFVNPAGNETFVGDWTAPVTVNGTSGELDLAVFGRDNGVFSGTFFARGTGGLAGLVGQGSFSGQDATGMGTYTFHYNTFHHDT